MGLFSAGGNKTGHKNDSKAKYDFEKIVAGEKVESNLIARMPINFYPFSHIKDNSIIGYVLDLQSE